MEHDCLWPDIQKYGLQQIYWMVEPLITLVMRVLQKFVFQLYHLLLPLLCLDVSNEWLLGGYMIE